MKATTKTHPLAPHELQESRAAVGSVYVGLLVITQPGDTFTAPAIAKLVRATSEFVPLPARYVVQDEDGRPIRPLAGSRFWISADTADPFHLLIDAGHLPIVRRRIVVRDADAFVQDPRSGWAMR